MGGASIPYMERRRFRTHTQNLEASWQAVNANATAIYLIFEAICCDYLFCSVLVTFVLLALDF
jgi:hypothetical protein